MAPIRILARMAGCQWGVGGGGVLACSATTKVPGHSGVAEGSTGCLGNKSTPVCMVCEVPGVWEGG